MPANNHHRNLIIAALNVASTHGREDLREQYASLADELSNHTLAAEDLLLAPSDRVRLNRLEDSAAATVAKLRERRRKVIGSLRTARLSVESSGYEAMIAARTRVRLLVSEERFLAGLINRLDPREHLKLEVDRGKSAADSTR